MMAEHTRKCWTVYHESYDVCLILNNALGVADWIYRGRKHSSICGNLMLMEPGETHRTLQITAPGSCDVVRIPAAMLQQHASEAGIEAKIHWQIASCSHPKVSAEFHLLHQVLKLGGSSLELSSVFTRCVSALLASCSEKHPGQWLASNHFGVRRARDYLHEHWLQSISLQELAAVAGLSRFHFLRAFAKAYGVPPHAYQIALRVEHVRVQLIRGVPPAQIEAGFADQGHLSRHFRAIIGVNPGRYQSMVTPRAAAIPKSQ